MLADQLGYAQTFGGGIIRDGGVGIIKYQRDGVLVLFQAFLNGAQGGVYIEGAPDDCRLQQV